MKEGAVRKIDRMWGGSIQAYSFVIFESILVLVCLLAADNGASERLGFFVRKNNGSVGDPSKQLLFADPSCNIAIRAILSPTELKVGVGRTHPATGAKQPLSRLIDAKIDHIIIVPIEAAKLILILAHGVILHAEITEPTHHAFVDFGRGPWSG